MNDSTSERPRSSAGDRRDGDRRQRDRRKGDRRTPPPPWRRSWALVAYGLVAGLALVLLLDTMGGDEEEAPLDEALTTSTLPPAVGDEAALPAAERPVQDAYTAADFQRLIAEGESARGQRVRTELFCGSITQFTLLDVGEVNPSVAEVAGANRQVPAAECRWGEARPGVTQDFLLIVPPELAEAFARAPIVTQGFVDRRRVLAEVEWVGQSQPLAQRTAGVLREVLPAS